jgi:hypothetical protein
VCCRFRTQKRTGGRGVLRKNSVLLRRSPNPKTAARSQPGAVRKKSPTWWIRYYTPDGQRHKVKGYRDRKATERGIR